MMYHTVLKAMGFFIVNRGMFLHFTINIENFSLLIVKCRKMPLFFGTVLDFICKYE
jgi:hypothetical protein